MCKCNGASQRLTRGSHQSDFPHAEVRSLVSVLHVTTVHYVHRLVDISWHKLNVQLSAQAGGGYVSRSVPYSPSTGICHIIDLYRRGDRFDSRPGRGQFCQSFIVVFSIPSRQMRG
jgi:hypothetical protein